MNWNKFAALMVALSGFVAIVTAVERKPARKVTHILPKVEDMYENPNPLQF
jgi:hypothetical protein